MINKIIKTTISLLLCFSVGICFSGCATGKFESILPPANENFPFAEEYEMTEPFMGDLVVEKSFYGNKDGNTLYVYSDSGTISDFAIGDTGTVTYSKLDGDVTVKGVLTLCPENASSGKFVVEHQDASSVNDKFPGKFSVIVAEYKNCMMLNKAAVLLLDEDGNALVQKVDENGLLYDVSITVGAKNTDYYQVLSGLRVGESVIIR